MTSKLGPYPVYKNSNNEWLGQVPKHWKILRLKNWVQINEAVLAEDTDPDYRFDYLDIGSVSTGVLTADPEQTRFEGSPSRARRVVRMGDTILSTVRPYLKAVWHAESVRADLIASTGFAVLTPRPGVSAKFVSYSCQSDPFTSRLAAESVGIAYPAIAETRLGTLEISVPPLPEQAAIVRFLDPAERRIRRYIRAKQKLITLLEEQKQAIIHQAVTGQVDVRTGQPYPAYKPSGVEWLGRAPEHWTVASLRHRYSQCLGKMLDSKRITGRHLLPYLRNTDIQWDRINIEDLPTMDISPNEYDRYTVQPGDLLVCEGGEIGRCALWSDEPARYGFQKALHRLRPRNEGQDVARFMYYALRAAAKGHAFNDGHLSTIAHLTGDKLRTHRFPFPNFPEQAAIVRYLDKATAAIAIATDRAHRQIDLLREYRTHLIAAAVTGKIDVREEATKLPEVDPLADEFDALTTQATETGGMELEDATELPEEFAMENEVII